ncbi:RNA polymerase sigma factor (sigma-70 family) [Leucobacter luti]|uniref:RNA polymerase sigma factor n=1 Tax=Leucobacter luti TaxID=340320 RepID=UPI0010D33021|nr:sigma-70 family RNA polymerase sigma factor [Leucobacter luti]MCW2289464.1 RNA polymerase sigma factor (sigma-70 family) [Leucobacter luti]TCK40023.1 RNA polymerase sigma factor (sigma-70 family) [Leucobacter luti]
MKTATKVRGEHHGEILQRREGEPALHAADGHLIAAARTGDRDAFGQLWQLHHQAVCALTYPLAFADTEDTVSEAFTAVWDQLQRGRGPVEHFRAYVVAVSRNIASRRYHERQRTVTSELLEETPAEDSTDFTDGGSETRDIIAAFASLPDRWQQILWWQEVEERPRTEIAERLSLSPNSVSALTRRAREGLRLEWLRQQLPHAVASGHEDIVGLLPKFVRGAVSGELQRGVATHLSACTECAGLERGLRRENHRFGRKIAAGGALALALGGTLTTDLWAAPTAASAAAFSAAPAGGVQIAGAGTSVGDFVSRGARAVARHTRRATQGLSHAGGGALTAGIAVATTAAVALAVGVTAILPLLPQSGRTESAPTSEQDPKAQPESESAHAQRTPADDSTSARTAPPAEADTTIGSELRAEPASTPVTDPDSPGVPQNLVPPEEPTLPPQLPEDEPAPPEQPTNPEKPVEPTNPEKPVEPTNPEKPVEPTNPEKPVKPTDPEVPAVITVARGDADTDTLAPLLTGRAAPLATVRIDVSGHHWETTASAAGEWHIDLAPTQLVAGAHVAAITHVENGTIVATTTFPFTLAQPSATFTISVVQGPDGVFGPRIWANVTGQPLTEVCVWSSRVAMQRVALDAQGAGSLQLRVADFALSLNYSYCSGERMGVTGTAPLVYQ